MIFGGKSSPRLLVGELPEGLWFLDAEKEGTFGAFEDAQRPGIPFPQDVRMHKTEADALRRAREIIADSFPNESLARIDAMITEATTAS